MKYDKSICSQDSFKCYHQVHRFSEGFGIEGVGTEDVGGHGFVTNTTGSNPYPLLFRWNMVETTPNDAVS